MKILALGFNGAHFFANHLRHEAQSRNHTFDQYSVKNLTIDVSQENISITVGDQDIREYDVIHVGAIGKNRWPTIAALDYASKEYDCKIIDKRLIESSLGEYSAVKKYFLEQEHKINLPRTIVFKTLQSIKNRLNEFTFPVVIKTNTSKQGKGVGIAYTTKDIENFIEEKLSFDKKSTFALREHIPNDGDYRVNVIDGKAIMCLKRTPKKNEFRSNISLGGTLTDAGLEDTKDICAAAEKIAQLGNYDIAGVDVMVHKENGKPYILEVNRAPSGLEDDTEVSGINLAKIIVDYYEYRNEENNSYISTFLNYFSNTEDK